MSKVPVYTVVKPENKVKLDRLREKYKITVADVIDKGLQVFEKVYDLKDVGEKVK
jgi:hypothetical protein